MRMNRVVAIGLVLALGHSSLALAEESLLGAASRRAAEASAVTMPVTPAKPVTGQPLVQSYAAQAQGGTTLQSSGLRKRTKWMIGLALAAGFVGGITVIDGKVENNTPSTLGTRQD